VKREALPTSEIWAPKQPCSRKRGKSARSWHPPISIGRKRLPTDPTCRVASAGSIAKCDKSCGKRARDRQEDRSGSGQSRPPQQT
jgi:hypothetical protein